MNLRSIRTVLSLGAFFLTKADKQKQLEKLSESDPIGAAKEAHTYVRKELKQILKITGSNVTVKGLENIPEDETCLFACNHLGFFDVIFLEDIIQKDLGYVAKDSLKKIPFLSAWMSLMRCLFLDRKDMKEGLKTIFKGADYLKEGYSMVIFPEGTRCKEGQLGEFKGASLKMAQRAKVPVIPIAITGTSRIFEDNSFLTIKPSDVTVSFGQPVRIHEMSRPEQKEAVNVVRSNIENMITEALSSK